MLKVFRQIKNVLMAGNPVVTPIDPDTLYFEEKSKALEAVNLIKQKRCGKIKGRTYADISYKKMYLNEGESVSFPTVYLDELLCTLIIDAHEGHKLATFDVPGVYLHS